MARSSILFRTALGSELEPCSSSKILRSPSVGAAPKMDLSCGNTCCFKSRSNSIVACAPSGSILPGSAAPAVALKPAIGPSKAKSLNRRASVSPATPSCKDAMRSRIWKMRSRSLLDRSTGAPGAPPPAAPPAPRPTATRGGWLTTSSLPPGNFWIIAPRISGERAATCCGVSVSTCASGGRVNWPVTGL